MQYIVQGLQVLIQPGYRRFILIPLMANLLLFVALTIFMVGLFNDSVGWMLSFVPDWLISWAPSFFDFLDVLVFVLTSILFLVMYGFSFSAISNIFAAPFNGLLAEKIQREAGLDLPEISISQMIVRTLSREVKKLIYFIWYGIWVALFLFILSYIPLFNLFVPFLAFLWGAWCLSIQYMDYAADSHGQTFVGLRKEAKKPLLDTMGFGSLVTGLLMVPVVNIFVMPVAVAGGTLLWLKKIHVMEADFNIEDVFKEDKKLS